MGMISQGSIQPTPAVAEVMLGAEVLLGAKRMLMKVTETTNYAAHKVAKHQ